MSPRNLPSPRPEQRPGRHGPPDPWRLFMALALALAVLVVLAYVAVTTENPQLPLYLGLGLAAACPIITVTLRHAFGGLNDDERTGPSDDWDVPKP